MVSLGSTGLSSTVSGHGLVDPLPVVGDLSEDGVGALAGQSVAHVSDEDVLAINVDGERTSTVSLIMRTDSGSGEDRLILTLQASLPAPVATGSIPGSRVHCHMLSTFWAQAFFSPRCNIF